MTDYEAFLAQHQSDIESMELPGAYGQYVHVAHAQLRFLRLCRPEPFEGGYVHVPHAQLRFLRLSRPESFEGGAPVKHSAEIVVDKETDITSVHTIEDAIQYVFNAALADYMAR